jgi:hypothetical protein
VGVASRSAVLATVAAALGEHRIVDGICVSCGSDDLDEMSRALVEALDEIVRLRHVRTPAGAAKYGLPIGSVIGGGGHRHVPDVHVPDVAAARPKAPAQAVAATPKSTRKTVRDRLVAAIDAHGKGESTGRPLPDFTRPQLLKVAKERGVALDRGEHRDSIAEKLIAHARAGEPDRKPVGHRPTPRKRVNQEAPNDIHAYHDDLNDAGLRPLADVVEHGTVRHEEALSGGIAGDTRKRVYDDGTQTVWKQSRDFRQLDAKHQADAEQLAPLVAHALGLRAPAVYRSSDDTVNMQFVDNAHVVSDEEIVDNALPHSDEGRMLGLLDLMINNPDRHGGNVMVRDEDRGLVPIDHGLGWSDLERDKAVKPMRRLISPYTGHYFKAFNELWVDNDLTPQDAETLRKRIEKLQPAFEKLGRTDWYTFMTARLRYVGDGAKGTKSRLLPEIT